MKKPKIACDTVRAQEEENTEEKRGEDIGAKWGQGQSELLGNAENCRCFLGPRCLWYNSQNF